MAYVDKFKKRKEEAAAALQVLTPYHRDSAYACHACPTEPWVKDFLAAVDTLPDIHSKVALVSSMIDVHKAMVFTPAFCKWCMVNSKALSNLYVGLDKG